MIHHSKSFGVGRTSGGFVPKSEWFHRTYNLLFASVLFIMILPMFIIICVGLLLTQGRSIFYLGPRMGRGQKVFNIIKFRTLDGEKARAMTRNGVLPPDSGIETPLGGFLRETRLDELPQLLNVIRGDMNLCGPRPVRPEIAGIYRRGIPRYDDRFAVRPGLVGHTQAYFNHGTSKAIRARYNSVLVRTSVSYRAEIGLLVLVGSCVLARSGRQGWRRLRSRLALGASSSEAGRATDFALTFIPDDGQPMAAVAVDEARLWLRTPDKVPEPVWEAQGEAHLSDPAQGREAPVISGRLTFRLPDGKLRVARVVLDPVEGEEVGGAAVYRYRPLSDFAYHVLSRYLLQNVVVPHKSHLVVVRVLNRLTRPRPQAIAGGAAATPRADA